ncbi:MAG TPA: TonB-dependent receptor [Bryobacteraceae bacterium]
MRSSLVGIGLSLLLSVTLFGQNDRGTITGQVKDQGGGVVPAAAVTATNTASGAQSKTASTDTGNYTIPALPAGTYSVTVEMKGFKKFVQDNVLIQVAATARVDATLEVGAATETVTVTADAGTLKTESAEQSTVIETDRINDLPLNFGGGGGSSGNIRSPFAFNMLSPGVTGGGSDTASVNGLPTGTFQVQVEGQNSTSNNDPNWTSTVSHESVDAIEEFSLQTSTFAAEYSQVGGGLYNFTTKSGTNKFHGTGYEYLTNEAFNAYRPYFTPLTPSTSPRSRKNDFGGTVGGPVLIPKIYNGRNRTFFFVSEEAFRNVTYANGSSFLTLPTAAMQGGDFSSPTLFPAQNLGTDPAGNAILNGAVYDPGTRRTLSSSGQVVAMPFQGNIIPQSRFDPVAMNIQKLYPGLSNANPTSNFLENNAVPNNQQAITFKIDESLPDNSKISFYFNKLTTNQLTAADSLPFPISAVRVQAIYGTVPRLNYDKPITPTMLLHLGVGYQRFHNPDSSPVQSLGYDAVKGIGFVGSSTDPSGFPRLNLNGGITALGPSNANSYYDGTFTTVSALTWVRGNHTFKGGAEFRISTWTDRNSRGAQGVLNFSANETGDPFINTSNFSANGVSGSIGNPYASFLLGQIDNATVNTIQDPQLRRHAWGAYLQDTWKVTSKLTLDYGIRWDLEDYGHEIHNRWVEFGPNTPNPTVNNINGALVYEGYGAGRCNCSFTKTYPFALGPRLGVAYQLTSKTVIRAGSGISYGPVPSFSYITNAALLGVGFNQLTFAAPAFGVPTATLSQGLQYDHSLLTNASLSPGLFPANPNVTGSPNFYMDPNAGRPPRIFQWSLGVQRELLHGLTLEANYVANRGVWENATTLLGGLNTPTPAVFAQYGIDPTTSAGQATLAATMSSTLGKASGVPLPYPTFPIGSTVLQALRPFPQVSNNVTVYNAPVGKSWYDSLQVKADKRYGHGFSLTSAFTWSKTLANPAGTVNNIFNRNIQKGINSNDIPFIFNTGVTYELQNYSLLHNSLLRHAVAGWTVGGIFLYQSGSPIATPQSTNNMSSWYAQNTLENRVPGQPLFIKNPNCHCIDPTTDFILNPAAWANPALGQWGTASAFYNDFRNARRPSEAMNIGRTFHFKEKMSLNIRADFFNVFNRMEINNPLTNTTTATAQGVRSCTNGTIAAGTNACKAGGKTPAGFGSIGYTSLQTQPRNGQLVARFTF